MLGSYGTHEAAQSIVEERIEQAERRRGVHYAMRGGRARARFRRSIIRGLRAGLEAGELASELSTIVHERSELASEGARLASHA